MAAFIRTEAYASLVPHLPPLVAESMEDGTLSISLKGPIEGPRMALMRAVADIEKRWGIV